MASKLKFLMQDSDKRLGVFENDVADVALPAGFQTKLTALTDALVDDTGAMPLVDPPESIFKTQLVIQSAALNTGLPLTGDIRSSLEMLYAPTLAVNGSELFRHQMPGRNTSALILSTGSHGFTVDTSNLAWIALVAALGASGVDVKTPYNIAASATLQDARARSAKRAKLAQLGGDTPGTSGVVSFVRVVFKDFYNRTAILEFPITAQALPTGYGAKITAVIDALIATGGGTKLVMDANQIVNWQVVIDGDAVSTPLDNTTTLSPSWIVEYQDDDETLKSNTFQIPGRNVAGVMTTVASKGKLLDTASPSWTAFQIACYAFPIVSGRDYTLTATLLGATTTVKKRKSTVA